MIIRLGETKTKSLGGGELTAYHFIDRETPKAVLLKIEKSVAGMEVSKKEHWLPKSQIKISGDKIEIPDWLWDAKDG